MGMSTHVVGLRSSDNILYTKHSKVLRACIDAGIKKLPQETADYFGSGTPCESLFDEALEVTVRATKWSDGDMREGYEVKVSEIPSGVETIRFYNSY